VVDKASRASEQLGETANLAANRAVDAANVIGEQTGAMVQASRESLNELKKAGDGIALRAKEIGEQMAVSVKASRDYSDELRRQSGVVADVAASSADTITKASGALSARMQDIGSAARDALGKIDEVRQGLAQETERLVTVSTTAVGAAEDASATFARQSNALFNAVQSAGAIADKIRKEEGRTQREAFMASAKFIIESLHSLSVDFSRMLEGEVSEKTWKAFQKGDIGAFTRRLAQIDDSVPMDKVRDKFAKDIEFRTYVQRFIRQFEEVYEQALANDHGDLLGATFASSDTGRLYILLCTAAGREPKLARTDRKAA
jgi:hypothetical protein